MEVILANPRGFCAGVDRAIAIVERAIEVFGAPIYVRHEIVHNKHVVDRLREMGAIFIDELADVPDDNTVIFSAHGVSKQVQDEANQRGLRVFDATCPLVTKVHLEVARWARKGLDCVLIGHAGHPEVEGTLGRFDPRYGGQIYLVEDVWQAKALQLTADAEIGLVTQTTLSMDDTASIIEALRSRYPNIVLPRKDDICYATQNRQDAVKSIVSDCDMLLVVGSPTSSNSNRLREVAVKRGTPAYLISDSSEITREWIDSSARIGVTAGASTPEVLVQEVVQKLQSYGATDVRHVESELESIVFSMPKALRP